MYVIKSADIGNQFAVKYICNFYINVKFVNFIIANCVKKLFTK